MSAESKPVILTFVRGYLPGFKYGGPVRTIANVTSRLGDELDFRIVTLDRDAHAVRPYEGIQPNHWNSVGKARVRYVAEETMTLATVSQLIKDTPHDLLYLNSFFDPKFTMLPLLARRLGRTPKRAVVIAPRGEFSAGALSLKKWKKLLYLAVAKSCGLLRNATWQASSEREAAEIRRALGAETRIVIAPNLASGMDQPPRRPPRRQHGKAPLRVVFVSRIAPMKNLTFALRVLHDVSAEMEFNIYGPIWDARYWKECQELIATLPAHVRVHYRGEVNPDEVRDVFARHDVFFLPTLGENFGHVILEALEAGTPVLLSDQTQWKSDASGACMAFPLDDATAFVTALDELANAGPDRRGLLAQAALGYADWYSRSEEAIQNNRSLFVDRLMSC